MIGRTIAVALRAFSATAVLALAACATTPSTDRIIRKFQTQVANNEVADVQVFYAPNFGADTPLSPDKIADVADYRCDFVLADPLRSELTNTLQDLRATPSRLVDVTWAASFWSQSGKLLFWIYLDERYVTRNSINGSINGMPVEMTPGLLTWLKGHFDEAHLSKPESTAVHDCWVRSNLYFALKNANNPK